MNAITVRMGRAGNGTPVFTVPSLSAELARPFGATRSQEEGLWMYPAYFPVAERVVEDLHALQMPISFSEAAIRHLDTVKRTREMYEALELPAGFDYVTPPFQHQIIGLAHAFHMLRAAIFFAPGLGKSKIVVDWIRLLAFLEEPGMTVIIGPLVTIRNWGKEINTHSGKGLRWGAMLGEPEDKHRVVDEAAAGMYDVLLVTYDTNRRYVDAILEKVPYTRIAADESHRIKNWDAARTVAAFELGQKAERKVILTGTPTLGSPDDLYGQFKFLAPYFMPENPRKYREKFFDISPANRHLVLGYKNLPILNRRTLLISIRKTKEECLDLPEQVFVDVEFDLKRQSVVVYNELIDAMGINIDELSQWLKGSAESGGWQPFTTVKGQTYTVPQVAVLLNKLSQVRSGFLLTSNVDKHLCDDCEHLPFCVPAGIEPYTQGCYEVHAEPEPTLTVFDDNAALETLEELLDDVLGDPANKALVWCRYSRPGTEIDMVSAMLTRKNIKHTRVAQGDGDKVFDLAEEFNADPERRVYVAQASTGEGITLNSANYTFFFNFGYALQEYLQPLDRNHRIGQGRKVTVYRLMASNTVDPIIVSLLAQKVDIDRYLTSPNVVVPRSIARRTLKAHRIGE